MKRNLNFFSLLVLALGSMLGGCKKWLDVNPKTEIRERVMLNDEAGFKDAVTGVYQHLGGSALYGQQLTMGVMDGLAQRYNVSATAHPFYQAARFNYEDAAMKGRIAGFWGGLYTGIANINNVLTQIDAKKSAFTENNFNIVKGEALALRAFMHFDLLRMFGTAPAVDGGKASIPYVTRFGVQVYPLLTVNQVIDSCLKDLGEAENLLSIDKSVREINTADPFLAFTRNHFNYWAVKGLQARILLYKGDEQGAMLAAKTVIDNKDGHFSFVTQSAAGATSNRDRGYAREQLFALQVFKLREYTEAYTKTNSVGGTPALVHTSSNINALYETSAGGSSDIRFVYQFTLYGGGYATTKFWQDDIANNPNYEYLRNNMPVIRLSEVYYIAAECAATPEEGVAYLNVIRSNRGLSDLNASITETSLQTEILKEYKKETYAEGQLFYYYKRKNASRVDGSSLTPNYVFPLPEDEIEFGNRF